jgi:hypothetical protein
VYNTPDEVAALVDGVRAAREFFGVDARSGEPSRGVG